MDKRLEEVRSRIEARKPRSAWGKGVKAQALDYLRWLECDCEGYVPCNIDDLYKKLLNGAENFLQASRCGCGGLVYDRDIMERYCSPSKIKKWLKRDCGEYWIRVQAQGMMEAALWIARCLRGVNNETLHS